MVYNYIHIWTVDNLGTDVKPFPPRTGGESTGVYLNAKHQYDETAPDFQFTY